MFIPLFILSAALLVLLVLLIQDLRRSRLVSKRELERNMMVALLSHRLRTPLTSIKWHTELLLNQEFGKLRISQMELLDKVNAGIADAIAVLNTFLEVSRIEQGAIGSKSVSIDVWQGVEGVVDEMRRGLAEKRLSISYPKPAERVTAYMNPLIFHTIIEVILDNAITYTPAGGSVDIRVERADGKALVHMKDTGIGMSDEEQKHLFTKFFRGERAKIIFPNGNGLGLYLIQQLLSAIDGSVRCVSKEGQGMTVTIAMPTEKN